ncbi:MAG: hypothetical protein KZQ72_15235 [Candidatus Thiodiazotropha sp. (ex Cardiolucina cf. quadrata)]|nr:hypothetical protein [Candidatus Thiodiazotropha sp. (ex Cardiolucina cf. quadrata)]
MKESANYLWMALLALQLTVQGCGGGGGSSDNPTDTGAPVNNDNPVDNTSNTYTGSESQAVVSEASAQDLAITAASGVKRAVDENNIVFPSQTAAKALNSTSGLVPMLIVDDSNELCPHGGTATIEEIEADPGFINDFEFNECSYGEGLFLYTYTGSIHVTYANDSDSSAFTAVYTGSMTTVGNGTQAFNKTFSCEAHFRNCNFFSDYSGYDGRLYRVTDISVAEEGNSAYTASGRIYDPAHGYIDVTTEIPFTLDCPDDHPGAGRLSFTGANQSSGSIEFISCTEYVVTTGSGTSNTYSW